MALIQGECGDIRFVIPMKWDAPIYFRKTITKSIEREPILPNFYSNMAAPQVPQLLDNQRLARPEDLERIGIVIVSSFRSNPKFAWQRAYHEQFPVDTLAWYSGVVASYLRDPNFVVVVALDKYDPDERSKSIAIIPVEETELKKGDPVIVGACAWRFEEGSKRKGQFSVKSSGTSLEIWKCC